MKKSLLLVLSILFSFLTFSCEQSLVDNKGELALIAMLQNARNSQASETDSLKYGSLSVYSGSNTRALDIDSINCADVTVAGYRITSISKENITVSSGAGSVKVENIPVGKNRVVTVQAKENTENILTAIAGVKMTTVTNINAGENSVTVNWASSAVGNVFTELLKLDYDVTSLDIETVESYLPKDSENKIIHAALIDSASLATDIKSDSVKSPENYKLAAGSVTFNANAAVSGITFQICDPVSKKQNAVVSGQNTVSDVAPGTWKVFGIVNGKTVVYNSSVTITRGGTFDLGDILFKVPAPRLENASGTAISEFINGETTVYLAARSYDGETEPEGVSIYYTTDGTEPSSSSTKYTGGFKVNVGTTVKAIAKCDGLFDSEVSSWTFARPKLGYTHPASGNYSPVDESSWGSGTWSLGANVSGSNTTFALYSANATKILLEIYGSAYGQDALYDYWMVKDSNNVWRAKLSGDLTGAIYAFRVWGPNWTFSESWTRGGSSAGFVSDCDSDGNRFNPNKVVYDPYAREMTHDASNAAAIGSYTTTNSTYALSKGDYQILSTGETTPTDGKAWREYDSGTISPKGYVVTDSTGFGTKPGIAASQARIYEAHVRGLTNHTSSSSLASILSGIDGFDAVENVPAEYRGTYKGAAFMAPYLKALGINTIELLPVHETDNDANPDDAPGGNYWGYMTFGYFAPDRRYSYDKTAGGPTREFKQMVKAFHDAGIEVYLDVVYNHSGEGGTWHGSDSDTKYDGGKQCTVVSMRGIDNQTYYSLVTGKTWSYWETTGCGNNLQCDNSVVRQFIIDSLSYWISDMGVDGFRFDLAPVLGREGKGTWNFSSSATTLTQIASLGTSNNVEMIAEAWDCQWPGGYKIGKFPTGWGDWNGVYRDVVRKYVGGVGTTETKSDNGTVLYNLNIGNALYGSNDIFGSTYRPSVNMIVAHDGFTLADLSSYAGAGNAKNNNPWPFGPSDGGNGDTNYIAIDTEAGHRQINRNYIALQMLTRGIPMIVWGDEFGRTQNGNNNPYNIDSVATWNNYNMINTKSPQAVSTGGSGSYTDKFGTFENTDGVNGNFIFMKRMLEMHSDPAFTQASYSSPVWTYQDGGDSSDATFGYKIAGSAVTGGHDFYFFSNMTGGEVSVSIPAPASGYHWVRICDTGNWAEKCENSWDPNDTEAADYYAITTAKTYGVGAWTVLVLQQVKDGGETPTCAAPTISGTDNFTGSSEITITSSDGASIYYTTDGTVPTANSSLYTAPFEITKTTTVNAIAVKTGYNNSSVASKKFMKNVPTVTLSFGGDTSFTESTTVSITADPSGAAIYYTTDGTAPTTSSTLYTGSFTLSETKTVKALGVYAGYEDSEVVSKKYTKRVLSSKSGVMLQGFNWDSAPRGQSSYWGKWYAIMQNNATQIGNTFEYVWCPPPSKTNTSSSEGYGPTEWFDLNNCYGTVDELKSMIQAISPAKAIADIVVNHRDGYSSWGDFANPSLGVVKGSNYKAICSDDEGFSASDPMATVGTDMRGAADTGAQYAASRDLDHTNTDVQDGIKQYLNDYLKPAGFVGWRYDFVKGYGGQYVGMYNAASGAEFAVGEYWPGTDDGGGYFSASDPSGWANKIDSWIDATETGGYRTRAFDFVLKGMMNDIWGCSYTGGSSSATNNFGNLANSRTLVNSQPAYAVTFVDNHDTGSTQGHWKLPDSAVPAAYAYILTHPGYPCVAWQHYFSYSESGGNLSAGGTQFISGNSAGTVNGSSGTLRNLIDALIELRKELGIEYDSSKEILSSSTSCYAARVDGQNGSFIVSIGSSTYSGVSSDYEEVASGTNYKVWKCGGTSKCKSPSISFADGKCTITCGTSGATIKYSTNGTSYSTYSAPFSVTEGTTVYAKATADGYEESSVVSNTYASETTYTITGDFPSYWGTASDVMYAYLYGGSDGIKWVPAEYSNKTFTFKTSYDFATCIAVRMKSGTTTPSWDNKWNQSNDITKTGTTMTASSFE